jgi:hypothetical protein
MPAHKNQPDACVPGPGSYENIRVIARDAKKITFGPKSLFNDVTHMERKKNTPGPGSYPNILSFDKRGKYVISTF